MSMLEAYRAHVAERAALGIPPLPLSAKQTEGLIELLRDPPKGEEASLVELLTHRVPAGVDDAARLKAGFLDGVASGHEKNALVSRKLATELLATMLGGFNIKPLIDLLPDAEVGAVAAEGLKKTLLVFDYFHDVKALADKGDANAKGVLQSWADAEWFTSRPEVPASLTLTVFKVSGETNTDDLSPAPDASTRPDIPLHALAMLKNARPGIEPDEAGARGPTKQLAALIAKGHPVAYVGDVVGTGSSRKSATNSVLWFTGADIPYVPNKRFGGVCLGTKIAPIFYNTMEDAGALPIELDVNQMEMGDVIELRPYEGKALKNGAVISRIQGQVRRDLRRSARRRPHSPDHRPRPHHQGPRGPGPAGFHPVPPARRARRFRQGLHARRRRWSAAPVGLPEGKGVRPGTYCEPKMTTVGSQDTTGPMTRDELKDLACLGFSADLVMQSFCHTAAYPKLVDVKTHRELPGFISNRGGVSLCAPATASSIPG